jgi:secreted PhoX family phosphatase
MSAEDNNKSGLSQPPTQQSFEDVCALSRRHFVGGGIGLLAASFVRCEQASIGVRRAQNDGTPSSSGILAQPGFVSVPASTADTVVVPAGYTARVFVRWGDPIGAAQGAPAFASDASNTAAEQALQFGMHHDGMTYFPLNGSRHGLFAVNHEYIDAGLLFPVAFDPTNAEHVQKAKNAHGVTVYEAKRWLGRWHVVSGSKYARRLTADSAIALSGPAAGHPLMQTAANPSGTLVKGTLGNCSNGETPWGTYLTCEENFNGYFKKTSVSDRDKRYGIAAKPYGVDLSIVDERFNLDLHPNEAHRFGWVVELDPRDPTALPKKRTALGRFKHENAAVTLGRDGHLVVYMGDDERNEYIYKFVSRLPATVALKTDDLLDDGTLYVARFHDDGRGEWLPLVHGQGPLVAPAFADQAEVLMFARQAGDALQATKMDRPEWLAVHPQSGDVFCTLTNNSKRGTSGAPPTDAANPREKNLHGHVIRWREAGTDAAALAFEWDLFVMAGDPASADPNLRGTIPGDVFSCPDGLAIDSAGRMWIMTDVSTSALFNETWNPTSVEFQAFGNNQMLMVDPETGEIKRFLTGPVGAEITGFTMTPDRRTLFVNVQHPGEPLKGGEENDPANPSRYSAWPDGGRPRSATVVITKDDGGEIGT